MPQGPALSVQGAGLGKQGAAMASGISIDELRALLPESAKTIALTPGAVYIVFIKRGSGSMSQFRRIVSRLALVNVDAVVVQCDDVDDAVRVLKIKAAEGGS